MLPAVPVPVDMLFMSVDSVLDCISFDVALVDDMQSINKVVVIVDTQSKNKVVLDVLVSILLIDMDLIGITLLVGELLLSLSMLLVITLFLFDIILVNKPMLDLLPV